MQFEEDTRNSMQHLVMSRGSTGDLLRGLGRDTRFSYRNSECNSPSKIYHPIITQSNNHVQSKSSLHQHKRSNSQADLFQIQPAEPIISGRGSQGAKTSGRYGEQKSQVQNSSINQQSPTKKTHTDQTTVVCQNAIDGAIRLQSQKGGGAGIICEGEGIDDTQTQTVQNVNYGQEMMRRDLNFGTGSTTFPRKIQMQQEFAQQKPLISSLNGQTKLSTKPKSEVQSLPVTNQPQTITVQRQEGLGVREKLTPASIQTTTYHDFQSSKSHPNNNVKGFTQKHTGLGQPQYPSTNANQIVSSNQLLNQNPPTFTSDLNKNRKDVMQNLKQPLLVELEERAQKNHIILSKKEPDWQAWKFKRESRSQIGKFLHESQAELQESSQQQKPDIKEAQKTEREPRKRIDFYGAQQEYDLKQRLSQERNSNLHDEKSALTVDSHTEESSHLRFTPQVVSAGSFPNNQQVHNQNNAKNSKFEETQGSLEKKSFGGEGTMNKSATVDLGKYMDPSSTLKSDHLDINKTSRLQSRNAKEEYKLPADQFRDPQLQNHHFVEAQRINKSVLSADSEFSSIHTFFEKKTQTRREAYQEIKGTRTDRDGIYVQRGETIQIQEKPKKQKKRDKLKAKKMKKESNNLKRKSVSKDSHIALTNNPSQQLSAKNLAKSDSVAAVSFIYRGNSQEDILLKRQASNLQESVRYGKVKQSNLVQNNKYHQNTDFYQNQEVNGEQIHQVHQNYQSGDFQPISENQTNTNEQPSSNYTTTQQATSNTTFDYPRHSNPLFNVQMEAIVKTQGRQIDAYISQVSQLHRREEQLKEQNQTLMEKIMKLDKDLQGRHQAWLEVKDLNQLMEEKVRLAEKNEARWHGKYNSLKKEFGETREVIVLYEGLLDKLTEQNIKLKDWVKMKKMQENSKSEIQRSTLQSGSQIGQIYKSKRCLEDPLSRKGGSLEVISGNNTANYFLDDRTIRSGSAEALSLNNYQHNLHQNTINTNNPIQQVRKVDKNGTQRHYHQSKLTSGQTSLTEANGRVFLKNVFRGCTANSAIAAEEGINNSTKKQNHFQQHLNNERDLSSDCQNNFQQTPMMAIHDENIPMTTLGNHSQVSLGTIVQPAAAEKTGSIVLNHQKDLHNQYRMQQCASDMKFNEFNVIDDERPSRSHTSSISHVVVKKETGDGEWHLAANFGNKYDHHNKQKQLLPRNGKKQKSQQQNSHQHINNQPCHHHENVKKQYQYRSKSNCEGSIQRGVQTNQFGHHQQSLELTKPQNYVEKDEQKVDQEFQKQCFCAKSQPKLTRKSQNRFENDSQDNISTNMANELEKDKLISLDIRCATALLENEGGRGDRDKSRQQSVSGLTTPLDTNGLQTDISTPTTQNRHIVSKKLLKSNLNLQNHQIQRKSYHENREREDCHQNNMISNDFYGEQEDEEEQGINDNQNKCGAAGTGSGTLHTQNFTHQSTANFVSDLLPQQTTQNSVYQDDLTLRSQFANENRPNQLPKEQAKSYQNHPAKKSIPKCTHKRQSYTNRGESYEQFFGQQNSQMGGCQNNYLALQTLKQNQQSNFVRSSSTARVTPHRHVCKKHKVMEQRGSRSSIRVSPSSSNNIKQNINNFSKNGAGVGRGKGSLLMSKSNSLLQRNEGQVKARHWAYPVQITENYRP